MQITTNFRNNIIRVPGPGQSLKAQQGPHRGRGRGTFSSPLGRRLALNYSNAGSSAFGLDSGKHDKNFLQRVQHRGHPYNRGNRGGRSRGRKN